MQEVYRYGTTDDCMSHWAALYRCLKRKTKFADQVLRRGLSHVLLAPPVCSSTSVLASRPCQQLAVPRLSACRTACCCCCLHGPVPLSGVISRDGRPHGVARRYDGALGAGAPRSAVELSLETADAGRGESVLGGVTQISPPLSWFCARSTSSYDDPKRRDDARACFGCVTAG